jgi:hypothetical protein
MKNVSIQCAFKQACMFTTAAIASSHYNKTGRTLPVLFRTVFLLVLGISGTPVFVFSQCTTGCNQATSSNSMPGTNNFSNTFCITTASTLTYNRNFDMNGGTVCVGPNVTFSSGGGNYNGNWTINNYGSFSRALSLNSGQTFHNYGTFTGSLTLNGGTVINYNGATLSPSSFTFNGGSFTNNTGGTATFGSSITVNSGATFINNGTFSSTGLTLNSSASVTLGGTSTINGNISNNGSISLAGVLTVTGNYNQNSSGSITPSSSAQCNALNITGTIQGQGTYNGINGLLLNKNLSPACGSCLINGASVTGTPANQITGPSLSVYGSSINGTITNPGGSPAATHYIVLRRFGAAVTDQPTNFTSYAVGNVIGNSTVVAVNAISSLSFTDANAITTHGCGTYHYAAFPQNSNGSCGTYNRTVNATNRSSVTVTGTAGAVGTSTAICSGGTSGTLTLTGYVGSIARWESSVSPFSTWSPISNTTTTYTSGPLTQTTQFRAVINGTGCGTLYATAATISIDNTAPVITCGGNQTINMDGDCEAIMPDYTSLATVSDNCTAPGDITVVQSPSAGSTLSGAGSQTIQLTATDASGNSSSCSFTLTKQDVTPPVITCPANITTDATSGLCGAVVNYSIAAADNCSGSSGCVPSSMPGYTLVATYGGHTYYRSNFSANWATANANAMALGGHLLTVSSAAENNLFAGLGSHWAGFTDQATEGTWVWVTGEPVVFTAWSTAEPNDYNGNEDHMQLNWSGTNWNDYDGATNYPYVVEFDCVSPTLTLINGLASGSVFPTGTTTVEYNATDGNGNTSANCSFTVTVNDVTPPTIVCPANISVNAASGACDAIVNYNPPVASDNCGTCSSAPAITGFTSLGVYNGNAYYISNATANGPAAFSAAAAAGGQIAGISSAAENNFIRNAATAAGFSGSYLIGFNDAATEGNFVWYSGETVSYTNWNAGEPNNSGNEDYTQVLSSGLWNDVVSGTALNYVMEISCITPVKISGLASGSTFPLGVSTIQYSATDPSGNSSDCSFTVTVSLNPASLNKTVAAAAATVCINNSTNITVASSDIGTSYQLRNNATNSNIGSPVAGTGGTISLPTGNLSITTTFNVYATASTCSYQLTNTATVAVNGAASVTPGSSLTACQSATPSAITLTGASVGGSASTGAWSITSGGGSLSSTAQTANPAAVTYTPAANYAGSVILTLTTNDPTGPCGAASASRTISINSAATVTAGATLTTCQSATPSAITLTGASVGGSATTGAWSITAGGGSLSSTAQTANPAAVTYTPAANYSGTVTLTLTTNDPSGPCGTGSATRTITVNTAATVSAGSTLTTCQSATPSPITLTGSSVGGSATTGAWSITAGGGSLSSTAQTANPAAVTYTPAANYSGTVTLTLTTNDPSGPCGAVNETRTITVNPLPADRVPAAQSAVVCSGSGTNINIPTTQADVNYQLRNNANNSNIGAAVAGTGGTINLQTGNLTSTTTFNVLATNSTTGCTVQMATTVTVSMDNIAPAISCPVSQSIHLNSSCSATLPDYTALVTVSDNCTATGDIIVTQSPIAGSSVSGAGTAVITLTATDIAGNVSTCTFNLSKQDVTAPVMTCPSNITTAATAGVCGAIVNYTVSSTDNCDAGSGCAPATIAGYTLIGHYGGHTYFRSNTSSNWPTAKTNAEALGAHLVTISSAAENAFLSGIGQHWGGMTDETVEGTWAWVTGEPVVYTSWQAGEPNNAGGNQDYLVLNYSGTNWDDQGNSSLPHIVEFDCMTVNLVAGYASGSVFPIGTTTVTYNATDASGNTSANCSFTVTVTDDIAPAIVCPANISVNAAAGACDATVNYNPPVATDNCGTCTVAPAISGFTALGVNNGKAYYISNATATAAAAFSNAVAVGGNMATISNAAENTFIRNAANTAGFTGSYLIGINDAATEGTFIWSSGAAVTYTNWASGEPNNSGGNEDYTQVLTNGQWNDIGGGASNYIIEVSCITPLRTSGLASGSVFPLGTSTINYSATDASGNTSTCSFTVTVSLNPASLSKTVTATAATICSGSSTNITVAASDNGISYQLRNNSNNANIGSPVIGTGGTINLPTGVLTSTTTFNVYATGSSCSYQLNNTATVTVNSAATVTPGTTLTACQSAIPSAITLSGASVGGGASTGAWSITSGGGSLSSTAQTATPGTVTYTPAANYTGTVTLTLTSNDPTGPCGAVSATRTITVNALPTNKIPTAAASAVCAGSGTNIQLTASQAGVNYQLRNNTGNVNIGTAVAGNGGTINLPTGNLLANTTFNVLATNNSTGCNIQMSATVTVTINALPTDKTPTAVLPVVCSGTATSIQVTASQIGVSYQLRNNANNAAIGSAVAGTGGTINLPTGTITTAITFNVLATNSTTSCAVQMTNTVTVNVASSGQWVGGSSGDWNTASNWCGGIPNGSTAVHIPDGVTIYIQSANAAASSVSIAPTGSLEMTGSYNLEISAGGSFINNGSFNPFASTGTVAFLGNGSIMGTTTFNNIDTHGALDFGTSSTVSGTFSIQPGGSVTGNSPTYTCPASVLRYRPGSTFSRGLEWTNNSSGAGYPANVVVQNNTTINFPAGGNGYICYDLTIDNGSALMQDHSGGSASLRVGRNVTISGTLSLGSNDGGDLYVGGNWTRNAGGLFNANDRRVTFDGPANFSGNGSSLSTITAPASAAKDNEGGFGGEKFDHIWINKSTVADSVVLLSNITVTREIGFTKGTFSLRNSDVTIVSNSSRTADIAPVTTPADIEVRYAGTGRFVVQRFIQNPTATRSWRLLTAPLEAASAPSINDAWQQGVVNPDRANPNGSGGIYNPWPGFGTHITGPGGLYNATNGFDHGTGSGSILYAGAGVNTWLIPSSTKAAKITDQKGWMLFVRGDRGFTIGNQYTPSQNTTLEAKGKINIGNISVPVTATKHVIGNPYPSAISLMDVDVAGTPGRNSTYYMWDPKMFTSYTQPGKWVTFTGVGNGFVQTTSESPYADDGTIESGQAFVVDVPAAGNIIFHETDKKPLASSLVGIENGTIARPVSARYSLFRSDIYALHPGGAKLTDGVLNIFSDNYNNTTGEEDARKMITFNTKESLSLLRDSVKLAIEKRKDITLNDTIFFSMSKFNEMPYRFRFEANNFIPGTEAFLEDKFTGNRITISTTDSSTVDFNITADPLSKAEDRFRVVFQSSPGTVLPVSFTAIKAYRGNNHNNIVEWKVENEINLHKYEIERSANGRHFTKLAEQAAQNSSSTVYQQTDALALKGLNYYRVKSIDRDGQFRYSQVVQVTVTDKGTMSIYPNPIVNNTVQLMMNGMEKGKYRMSIYSSNGQQVSSNEFTFNGADALRAIPVSNVLPKGIYSAEINGPAGNKTTIQFSVE